jgi:hypothetical protein
MKEQQPEKPKEIKWFTPNEKDIREVERAR